jgi:hypothetical protein
MSQIYLRKFDSLFSHRIARPYLAEELPEEKIIDFSLAFILEISNQGIR